MNRKQAAKSGVRLGLAAGLAAACPPAAAVVGIALCLKGVRRFAQTGNIDAARDMVTGFGGVDVSSLDSSGDSQHP